MRLLNINSLQFQEFFESEIPQYHILSHRWSKDEISYEEFTRDKIPDKTGYRKVAGFCRFIRYRRRDGLISRRRFHPLGARDGAANAFDDSDIAAADTIGEPRPERDSRRAAGGEWVWVDTCCIDKRSSAELIEAINSMFKWYRDAYECIVYLHDVPSWRHFGTQSPYDKTGFNDYLVRGGHSENAVSMLGPTLAHLKQSAWFTRGWTLQELLAPEMVVFYTDSWEVLGHVCKTTKCSRNLYAYGVHINEIIADITRIPRRILDGDEPLYNASIAQRMSWASRRTTARLEDEAYCLLGLFDVNMGMVYGEGRKAFRRLQLEIIQKSADQSLFAWTHNEGLVPIFAGSPAAFAQSAHVKRPPRSGQNPYVITNNGLRLETQLYLPYGKTPGTTDRRRVLELACRDSGTEDAWFTIVLVKGHDRYFRQISEDDRVPKAGKPLGKRVIYIDTGVEDTVVAGKSWMA